MDTEQTESSHIFPVKTSCSPGGPPSDLQNVKNSPEPPTTVMTPKMTSKPTNSIRDENIQFTATTCRYHAGCPSAACHTDPSSTSRNWSSGCASDIPPPRQNNSYIPYCLCQSNQTFTLSLGNLQPSLHIREGHNRAVQRLQISLLFEHAPWLLTSQLLECHSRLWILCWVALAFKSTPGCARSQLLNRHKRSPLRLQLPTKKKHSLTVPFLCSSCECYLVTREHSCHLPIRRACGGLRCLGE